LRKPARGAGSAAGGAPPHLSSAVEPADVKVSPYLYIAPFFILFGVVGLFPLLFTAYVSLFDRDLLDDHGTFIGLRNTRICGRQPVPGTRWSRSNSDT